MQLGRAEARQRNEKKRMGKNLKVKKAKDSPCFFVGQLSSSVALFPSVLPAAPPPLFKYYLEELYQRRHAELDSARRFLYSFSTLFLVKKGGGAWLPLGGFVPKGKCAALGPGGVDAARERLRD
eukprot:GHVT01095480.1.p1 GENE.GHVT01095480.1~~GHVT01095480.1.p1  ORF type:complete len:124 (-),score=24.55 GHVT01095480.1:359-730(-)